MMMRRKKKETSVAYDAWPAQRWTLKEDAKLLRPRAGHLYAPHHVRSSRHYLTALFGRVLYLRGCWHTASPSALYDLINTQSVTIIVVV